MIRMFSIQREVYCATMSTENLGSTFHVVSKIQKRFGIKGQNANVPSIPPLIEMLRLSREGKAKEIRRIGKLLTPSLYMNGNSPTRGASYPVKWVYAAVSESPESKQFPTLPLIKKSTK